MQIKRLKLSGFKSFVEPAELRIEPGLTGVVGPNGCGKSNLLEAIRWVMGEGSAKSLRGAGMDDVIFAGTATRPSRDFAEVSILAEQSRDVDNNDVEVVRRIERGAGSAYRINGRDVRAKDVGLLFADAATGAHSPALVSQGKISAVIAAKPADRRAMLEEAAGISGLHVRRKDAEQKLRATETNLARLDDVLADMETRANALRRQARAAERYRKLSDEIRIAEGRMVFSRWRDAAAAADKAKAEAALAEHAVSAASTTMREAAEGQSGAVSKLATVRAQALAARDAATQSGHILATLSAERVGLDRRISELAAQTRQLAADRDREGQLAHDASSATARLSEEAKALGSRIAVAEMERPALADRAIKAQASVRDAEVELAQALSAQAREQAEARVADAAFAAATARADRATREADRIAADRAGLEAEAPIVARRDAALQARVAADEEATAAQTRIDDAERVRSASVEAQALAEQAQATAQAGLSALEGEAKALFRAVETGAGQKRALDHARAQPGCERALAAALGDDLDAPIGGGDKRGWMGADVHASDPALADGMPALADFVTAPEELSRRLAQVALVDVDHGQPLKVGQRLVTRAGLLRRWDGYTAEGQGAAAAERLQRINRLAEIERAVPKAQDDVDAARTALTQAQAQSTAARTSGEDARQALAAAERASRDAAREEDQSYSALERLASRLAEFEERKARAATELGEVERDLADAKAAKLGLPDGVATGALVSRLQTVNEAARAHSAQIKADAAALDRSIGADRDRLSLAQAETRSWKSRSGEAVARMAEMDKRAKAGDAEALKLVDAPEKLALQIVDREAENSRLSAVASDLAAAERTGEEALRACELRLAERGEALALARERRAGAQARAENQDLRRIEMGRVSGERFECPPPLLPAKAGFDADTVGDPQAESNVHERLSADRERLGPVNLVAEQELVGLDAERLKSATERDELAEAVNRLRGSIGSLNREGRTRLLAAFELVNGHFQRLFRTLFDGGQAHLALIDSDDPLEAGLEIFAQPPGKRLQSLTLLSGGEQALTAVALIFGLFLTNPAPICVLDEVDAPLDDANIERFCDLLDEMTRETKTRYLIVTHNAVTMSRMHRLFGVTMIEQGVSRLVSVDLQAAEDLLAAE